jgi:7-cyano-7-deazaguanine reductase
MFFADKTKQGNMQTNELGSRERYDMEALANITQQRDIFVTLPNPHKDVDYVVTNTVHEFTALCPVTGQPDFAVFTIETTPDKLLIELKSLKLYMLSYRNRGVFHEAVTGMIAKDIIAAIAPRFLRVTGDFTIRGGISTKVVFEHHKKVRQA